jgi:hypothetical protein
MGSALLAQLGILTEPSPVQLPILIHDLPRRIFEDALP